MQALHGVDCEIPPGEMLVLPGPSGSGKSTLPNIAGGLDRPSAGQSFYRGSELTAPGNLIPDDLKEGARIKAR